MCLDLFGMLLIQNVRLLRKTCFLTFEWFVNSSTQNHAKSFGKYVKSQFGSRNVQNFMKSRDLDMSGRAKVSLGGQVLVSKGFPFAFLRYYTFPIFINNFIIFINHIFYQTNLSSFKNIYVLPSKFITFKIHAREIYGTYLGNIYIYIYMEYIRNI